MNSDRNVNQQFQHHICNHSWNGWNWSRCVHICQHIHRSTVSDLIFRTQESFLMFMASFYSMDNIPGHAQAILELHGILSSLGPIHICNHSWNEWNWPWCVQKLYINVLLLIPEFCSCWCVLSCSRFIWLDFSPSASTFRDLLFLTQFLERRSCFQCSWHPSIHWTTFQGTHRPSWGSRASSPP